MADSQVTVVEFGRLQTELQDHIDNRECDFVTCDTHDRLNGAMNLLRQSFNHGLTRVSPHGHHQRWNSKRGVTCNGSPKQARWECRRGCPSCPEASRRSNREASA